ncbi:hypothetical protein PILCRDRAFT_812851 [Piloderma croceum F 1598]|uniref:Uncharacterized protein n=1 Tax=Piloderma croceum (strain F 1598) TaxID=765440 RepID=A0A0C3CJY2_PILCF|nr:hypothetical protein PILCRDRAFT_812851 [Piloderma croceum F 1598]
MIVLWRLNRCFRRFAGIIGVVVPAFDTSSVDSYDVEDAESLSYSCAGALGGGSEHNSSGITNVKPVNVRR